MDTFKKGNWIITNTLFKKSVHFLYKFVKPKSKDEDSARREFILNTLLFGSGIFSFVAAVGVVVNFFSLGASFRGVSPVIAIGAFLFFLVLYTLSRRGFYVWVAYIFVAMYFVLATNTIYFWGIDVPQALLVYALVIIMSGVLVGTRFASMVTLLISLIILILGYFQNSLITHPDLHWKQEMLKNGDAVVIVFTLCVTMLVSWLSNREIEKSLLRARAAELELRKERDSLEVKVKERTAELERAQFEKNEQMHRFVEFGRAASGIFHDMVNPVQAAMLSLGYLKQIVVKGEREDIKNFAAQASAQMEKARDFINVARSQLTQQEINIDFDPEEQIALVFQMLSFRAKREKVQLIYKEYSTQFMLKGNPLSFNRLIAGLVSNAIDSYDEVSMNDKLPRTVLVTSEKHEQFLIVSVHDNGAGMSKENQKRIFELFFTTKGLEKGTGIGLVICKEIAEKEFNGKIYFESEEGKGTVFTLELPIEI